MFSIIFGKELEPDLRIETKQVKINLTASTCEDLLIVWLNELLYRFSTEKTVPIDFKCNSYMDNKSIWFLTIKMSIRKWIEKKDKIVTDIKAATYHDLKIFKLSGQHTTKIVFDI